MMTFLTQTAPIIGSVVATALYLDRRMRSLNNRLEEQKENYNVVGSILIAMAEKNPGIDAKAVKTALDNNGIEWRTFINSEDINKGE